MNYNSYSAYFEFNDLSKEDLKEIKYTVEKNEIKTRRVDFEHIKAIYQQAFIFDLLYRFAKDHLPNISDDEGAKQKRSIDKSTSTRVDSIKEKVIEYLFSQVRIQEDKQKNQISDSSINNIWTSEDLMLLRSYLKRSREENASLKSKLETSQEELVRLRSLLEKAEYELKKSPKSSIELLENENKRLYYRIQELEKRYSSFTEELLQTDKTITQMKRENDDLRSKNNLLSHEKNQLEYKFNKCMLKLKLIKSETDTEMESKCESIRITYSKEIEMLTKSLNELKGNFRIEKNQHERCKKALENLRNHFEFSQDEFLNAKERNFVETKICFLAGHENHKQ